MAKKTHTTKKRAVEETRSQVPPPDVPSSFEAPESSTIAQAVYDSKTETLLVYFRRGDRPHDCYQYDNVPPTDWAAFVAAESKGTFFSKVLRPQHQGKQLIAR